MIACLALANRTCLLDDSAIVQGFPPLRKAIPYTEIARIHHVHVSGRYGATPCLAITAKGGKRRVLLPLRSFSVEKRSELVALLKERTPAARVEVSS